MDRFTGRGALVIGGASGIGRAIAERLGAEGASVAVGDRNVTGARQTAALVGGAAFEVDVADEASVRALVQAAAEVASPLRAVVSTAGYLPMGRLEETSLEQWNRSIAVNASGAFLVAKHAADPLRRAGGGAMTFFSSTSGLQGGEGEAAYAAAKGEVISFMKVAAVELALMHLGELHLPWVSRHAVQRSDVGLPRWQGEGRARCGGGSPPSPSRQTRGDRRSRGLPLVRRCLLRHRRRMECRRRRDHRGGLSGRAPESPRQPEVRIPHPPGCHDPEMDLLYAVTQPPAVGAPSKYSI
jgi:NADP-dependent 3-hydroxy acid dehydrogenase YdfG